MSIHIDFVLPGRPSPVKKSANLPIYLVDLIPPSKVGGNKQLKRHDFLSIFLMMPFDSVGLGLQVQVP
ncbi:hypothetical protein DAPPUDRAFT_235885 [Daphnia pulex]|uniref:Uncharacterized protein n=1 Tax=Daphnia pulex TaxID=6669 RepID=E9FZB2_DAPPU|nr:hypothetical protein DAPPUDRAFT_235885 [Daphnia pulex]|eukprot:EFX87295.1 hypothetical protein DAPPUDRAFT_235885 [Daphnia pulex]